MTTPLDLSPLRHQFPALQQTDDQGRPYVFFDGPGGTQVPQNVIDAFAHVFTHANVNLGGAFEHSRRAEAVVDNARQAMADFLNAPSPNEIVFGPSMSNLAFTLSQALGATLRPGDEIIVTRLDHDANISPWLSLREKDIVIKWVDFGLDSYTLDLSQLENHLSNRTKLVAVSYASNAIGTINPIAQIAKLAHQAGAKILVDAVHFAPHGPIDVQALDVDYLLCSPYKFFGPHAGVLWGRYDLLQALPAYKVRPAPADAPGKFEKGTAPFETLAGITAAIDYLANVGRDYGADFPVANFDGRSLALKQAMQATATYERPLLRKLLEGLQAIPGVTIYGLTDPAMDDQRTPTVAFTKTNVAPPTIAQALGDASVFVWQGHYYAIEVAKRLGVYDKGGMIRVGLVHYNTATEIDRLLNVVENL